jgi:hypothetical protein
MKFRTLLILALSQAVLGMHLQLQRLVNEERLASGIPAEVDPFFAGLAHMQPGNARRLQEMLGEAVQGNGTALEKYLNSNVTLANDQTVSSLPDTDGSDAALVLGVALGSIGGAICIATATYMVIKKWCPNWLCCASEKAEIRKPPVEKAKKTRKPQKGTAHEIEAQAQKPRKSETFMSDFQARAKEANFTGWTKWQGIVKYFNPKKPPTETAPDDYYWTSYTDRHEQDDSWYKGITPDVHWELRKKPTKESEDSYAPGCENQVM